MNKKDYTILQISDIHYSAEDTIPNVSTKNDITEFLAEVIDRKIKIDCCLVTGDLAHNGDEKAYQSLNDLFNSCPFPIKIIPGNHDDVNKLTKYFNNDYFPSEDIWQYDLASDLVIIGLSSNVSGFHHGEIDSSVLDKLETIVKSFESKKSWILALHHPPHDIGHWWMDAQGLIKGREEIIQIADNYDAKAILCGHTHISSTVHRKTPIIIAPSISHEVVFDDAKERPLRFRKRSPRGLLHKLSGETFISVELTTNGKSWLVNGKKWLDEVYRSNNRLPAKKMDK